MTAVAGFDAKGRDQLQGKVCKTRKWIGTTEVASVLRNLNLRWVHGRMERLHSVPVTGIRIVLPAL